MASVPHQCSHKQCIHGECLDHQPDWEDVGEKRREPSVGFFGKRTYWFSRCCGKSMSRYKDIQTRRCKKCGRTKDFVTDWAVGLCLCCGRTVDHNSYEM